MIKKVNFSCLFYVQGSRAMYLREASIQINYHGLRRNLKEVGVVSLHAVFLRLLTFI